MNEKEKSQIQELAELMAENRMEKAEVYIAGVIQGVKLARDESDPTVPPNPKKTA